MTTESAVRPDPRLESCLDVFLGLLIVRRHANRTKGVAYYISDPQSSCGDGLKGSQRRRSMEGKWRMCQGNRYSFFCILADRLAAVPLNSISNLSTSAAENDRKHNDLSEWNL